MENFIFCAVSLLLKQADTRSEPTRKIPNKVLSMFKENKKTLNF